jgi:tetratricopeptide (TPR) repeat protein
MILAFYNPIVHNDFTNFDDNYYITDNTHVRAGLTWDTVKWSFTSFEAANWHPLTWLSHALDCQLFKLNPIGHHYVNVLMHVLNAILLFLLLQSATGFTWRSFIVAGLFALHPVNVESVAWAAERKNVLSMLFFLMALHAYGWYVRRETLGRYALVAILFALGLMAKPEIITFPFVLLLWDYWPLRRMGASASPSPQFSGLGEAATGVLPDTAPVTPHSFSFLCLEKMPLLLLSLGSAVITWLAQRTGHAFRGANLAVRIGNALVSYVRYLGKAVWPTQLAALYPHPGSRLPRWEMFASGVILLLLTALVLHWSQRRYLAMGWFWFLGTLVPVLGLVQVGVQSMADRYAYIPYIGLFVCAVWGVAEIVGERALQPAWLVAPAVLVLATLGAVSAHQIGYWRDSEIFWRHILSVTELNYTAHDGLARVLGRQGRSDEAIAEFNAAENAHQYPSADMVEVAIFEQAHGHVGESIAQYEKALDAAEDSKTRAVVLSRLASAFIQAGDIEQARKAYGYALNENPDNTQALVGSALLAERDGKVEFAVAQISHAMQVDPTDVGFLLLAQALRRTGQVSAADAAYAQAQRISHDFVKAKESAAKILVSAGIKI